MTLFAAAFGIAFGVAAYRSGASGEVVAFSTLLACALLAVYIGARRAAFSQAQSQAQAQLQKQLQAQRQGQSQAIYVLGEPAAGRQAEVAGLAGHDASEALATAVEVASAALPAPVKAKGKAPPAETDEAPWQLDVLSQLASEQLTEGSTYVLVPHLRSADVTGSGVPGLVRSGVRPMTEHGERKPGFAPPVQLDRRQPIGQALDDVSTPDLPES